MAGSTVGAQARLAENEGSNRDDPKVDHYYGDRTKLRAYLIQLKLAFALRPVKFRSETTKVIFAATALKGNAFSWFKPTLTDHLDGPKYEPETEEIISSFSVFESKLK